MRRRGKEFHSFLLVLHSGKRERKKKGNYIQTRHQFNVSEAEMFFSSSLDIVIYRYLYICLCIWVPFHLSLLLSLTYSLYPLLFFPVKVCKGSWLERKRQKDTAPFISLSHLSTSPPGKKHLSISVLRSMPSVSPSRQNAYTLPKVLQPCEGGGVGGEGGGRGDKFPRGGSPHRLCCA